MITHGESDSIIISSKSEVGYYVRADIAWKNVSMISALSNKVLLKRQKMAYVPTINQ